MTSSLPPALEHYRPRHPDISKRAAQRVIHTEEIALGFAAVSVWTYAVFILVTG
jgi:hypothetical protein